jgi:hypothetical protein
MENLEVKIRALVAHHSGVSRVLHVDYCGRFIDTAVVIAAIEKLVVSAAAMATVELRMIVGPDHDEPHSCLNVIKSIVVTQTECVSDYHWGRFVRREDMYGLEESQSRSNGDSEDTYPCLVGVGADPLPLLPGQDRKV